MIWLRVTVFLLGAGIVAGTLYSAIGTFVLPRGALDWLTRLVLTGMRIIFVALTKLARSYRSRDRIMAFYAPVTLLLLVPIWYTLVGLGFMGMYWAFGAGSWWMALRLSGSSLLTLGFSPPEGMAMTLLSFSEATLGLILVALLIAYLPTMYSAFSRREAAVALLEVRAGTPPSAVEMLQRFNRIHGLDQLGDQWRAWEAWFADIDESHTSLLPLVFFRSQRPNHSWVTAAGAVLDAAALTLSAVDIHNDPQAALCIRAGYLTLRRIANFFNIFSHPDPHFPQEPISITQDEFEQACSQLEEFGIPLIKDRNQAWVDFAGWRVNYDKALVGLANLTMAPHAMWSSDRASDDLNSIPWRIYGHTQQ